MAKPFKPCSAESCNGNAHHEAYGRKGYCSKHYSRLIRHGRHDGGAPGRAKRGAPQEFLRDVVLPYEGDDCLIWPFTRSADGYARVWLDHRKVSVGKLACEELNGPPPSPNHEAAHFCGNGHLGCVSKRHLSWKTPLGNAADRDAHDTTAYGERNGFAKLTDDDVRRIRELERTMTTRELASMFGVSFSTIWCIGKGRRWARVR